MPKVPYPYEVNGKLVTGYGSLIPICSLSNRSLLPSLTVQGIKLKYTERETKKKNKNRFYFVRFADSSIQLDSKMQIASF